MKKKHRLYRDDTKISITASMKTKQVEVEIDEEIYDLDNFHMRVGGDLNKIFIDAESIKCEVTRRKDKRLQFTFRAISKDQVFPAKTKKAINHLTKLKDEK